MRSSSPNIDLPFPLLSDPEKKIVSDYGVWVEKSMYGKKYMGAERTTFVIDGAGRIAEILRKVKPAEHVDQQLARRVDPAAPARNELPSAAIPLTSLRATGFGRFVVSDAELRHSEIG